MQFLKASLIRIGNRKIRKADGQKMKKARKRGEIEKRSS